MAMIGQEPQQGDEASSSRWIELVLRLSVLALLVYLAFTLIQPFLTIVLWSVVLTVALYPLYDRMAAMLGGYRKTAAFLLTLFCLVIVIGPATWLVMGLIDSIRTLSERLDPAIFVLPQPYEGVRNWPLIGEQVFQYWSLAANNMREALAEIVPYLRPVGGSLLGIATDAGVGALKFFAAIVVAGFLYPSGPTMANAIKRMASRLDARRGEQFITLAGATIRSVSRGVVGISALQAFLAGIGLMVAGIPGASLLTSAILILGIIQIGPTVVIVPLIIWCWTWMDTTSALLFTVYMIPVNLIDNVLRPLVMARGLETPMLIILIGVVGGTLSYGITGLFLGPIILAVIWELTMAWIKDDKTAIPP